MDIIKPTLKKDFLVQDEDTMPEIKNDGNSIENNWDNIKTNMLKQ